MYKKEVTINEANLDWMGGAAEKELDEINDLINDFNEDELEEDEDGNLIRTDEEIILDDEFDDTFGEVPDGYVVDENNAK